METSNDLINSPIHYVTDQGSVVSDSDQSDFEGLGEVSLPPHPLMRQGSDASMRLPQIPVGRPLSVRAGAGKALMSWPLEKRLMVNQLLARGVNTEKLIDNLHSLAVNPLHIDAMGQYGYGVAQAEVNVEDRQFNHINPLNHGSHLFLFDKHEAYIKPSLVILEKESAEVHELATSLGIRVVTLDELTSDDLTDIKSIQDLKQDDDAFEDPPSSQQSAISDWRSTWVNGFSQNLIN
jgi:hypothetical protein